MVSVEIQYCMPREHLGRAQGLEAAILAEYGLKVDRVVLVTGDSGVFTLRVDGESNFDIGEGEYDASATVEGVGGYVGATA